MYAYVPVIISTLSVSGLFNDTVFVLRHTQLKWLVK